MNTCSHEIVNFIGVLSLPEKTPDSGVYTVKSFLSFVSRAYPT